MTVMVGAVRKAARGLQRDFGEVENLQVSLKGPADFVSAADMRAEKVLREELEKARPGYGFLLEEQGEIAGTDTTHRWIIDPLDGTTNFLHGIPHFAVNVALEREKTIVAAITYNPITNEMFWAERGRGAYLNNRRLRVAARRELSQAVIVGGAPHLGRPGRALFMNELAQLLPQIAAFRRSGSAALDLAYVAAGRYDGYWEASLNAWDIAAGILLVREAGGYVSDVDGGEQMLAKGNVLAANDALHRPLLSSLKSARTAG